MLYGVKAANVPTYLAKIRSSYRISALRVARSNRNVSNDAICVISSMILIELEQAEIDVALQTAKCWAWKHNKKNGKIAAADGRWTYDLIHDINIWLNSKHGELGFYMTPMISGHGCFKEYLYRFKIVQDLFVLVIHAKKRLHNTCCCLVRALTILDTNCKPHLGSFQQ